VNVKFRIDVPPGPSSPCISGNRIFLAAYEGENDKGELVALCLDRTTGEKLWRSALPVEGTIERGSRLSHPASSTPAIDETRAVFYFAAFGLVAYALEGKELWRNPLPTPLTGHGASTSPVIEKDRVFLACDQDVGSHILAIDARSGKTLWRTERPGFRRGFATPILWPEEAPTELILPGTLRVVAYDIESG